MEVIKTPHYITGWVMMSQVLTMCRFDGMHQSLPLMADCPDIPRELQQKHHRFEVCGVSRIESI